MSIDIPTELLTASSGSVGGVVFSRNQHGPYTRARTAPTDPGSAAQLAVRAALSQCVTAWSATLTETERQGWDAFALALRTRTRLGRSTNAGGLGMYIRANVPRLQAAEAALPRVDQAPTLLTSASFTPITRVVLNIVDDTIHPFFSLQDDWTGSAAAAMLFYASPPQPLTRNFWNGPYRYAGPMFGRSFPSPPNPGTIAIPFPAGSNERLFVRFRLTLSDARLSHPARLPADVVPQVPPLPVSALFTDLGFPNARADVTFDALIRDQPHFPGNWTVRHTDTIWSVTAAATLGDVIRLTLLNVGISPGPNRVIYFPVRPDVNGLLTGLPVAGFQIFIP